MQTNGLMRLCPLLHNFFYDPHPVSRQSLAKKLMELLKSNQVVVVSGKDKGTPQLNYDVGKTTALRTSFSFLSAQIKQTSYYCNILIEMRLDQISFGLGIDVDNGQRLIDSFKDSDVYIFDEVHALFPRTSNKSGGIFDIAEHQKLALHFWQKINLLIKDGKKMVFVTALHPQNQRYRDFRYNETMLEFFQAPVIELS